MPAPLEVGREAARRHAWPAAVEALTAADHESGLAPDDLELLGGAAWWAAMPDESTDALERAFGAFEAAGRGEDAARVAISLAYQAYRRLAGAIGAGWAARADELLRDNPRSPLHAWTVFFTAIVALDTADFDAATELLDRAMEAAGRTDNRDAFYLALAAKGVADVLSGRWKPGLAAIDEAAAAAASGSLDLRAASDIFCMTIGACRSVGDLQRAAQWAEESERWMRRNGAGGYPGICRIHRAEIKMLHGHWSEAEQEAREACDELQRYRLIDSLGLAYNAIGEVRLRMGDLDGAAEAFDRAYEVGHPAQPGTALLLLAHGKVDEARRSIDRAIATASGSGRLVDRAARGGLLPAQVEIALAGGDTATARQAVEELETIATDFAQPLYRAGALTARGELLLGEGKPVEASPVLGQSWRLWQTTDLPLESARARLRYAEALVGEGDDRNARRDLQAARTVFERLGATLDVRRVDEVLARLDEDGASRPVAAPERATRAFMFSDIVTSTDLVGIIGDEAWNELLEWHDRELRAAIAVHRGEVVNHTGDGFFAAFERPADAIEAAIDIQRRLVRHRREHGFAPSVRIGLHAAEATRRGRDYSGRAVHVAARIGAAAARDEILASEAALDDGSAALTLSAPRALELKGIREPIVARAIEWR